MKRSLGLALLLVLLSLNAYPQTSSSSAPAQLPATKSDTLSPLPALPDNYPKIDRKPATGAWKRDTITSIPKYDANSDRGWQVDLRSRDLSNVDLRESSDDLKFADFDSLTRWPSTDKMPPDFDWRHVMELGKNPGLGVRQLHDRGVDGRGVGIAIIDQTLLVDHQEYSKQLRLYEETNCIVGGWLRPQMHGPAVASIAVGKTVGVAPGADLYYIGTAMCSHGTYESNDFSCLAQSVRRILEINRTLPQGRKIRVISMSVGWAPASKGYSEITAATKQAVSEGMLVICSSVEEVHGFLFAGLGRVPSADPDRFESYEPGMFWAKRFYDNQMRGDRLMVPMDSRTTAGFQSTDTYAFYRQGGWSWAIPYIAGVYALAAQVKPDITPNEFWRLALKSGRSTEIKNRKLQTILDPLALISTLTPLGPDKPSSRATTAVTAKPAATKP